MSLFVIWTDNAVVESELTPGQIYSANNLLEAFKAYGSRAKALASSEFDNRLIYTENGSALFAIVVKSQDNSVFAVYPKIQGDQNKIFILDMEASGQDHIVGMFNTQIEAEGKQVGDIVKAIAEYYADRWGWPKNKR